MPGEPLRVEIDWNQARADIDTHRHGLGQGGIDVEPLTAPVVQRLADLKARTFRFFMQEYFQMMQAPGRYRWDTIDPMLQSVAATGAMPILSINMKPACLYPRIDHAVTAPNNWEHWENFISAMVEHFRDDLKLPGLWYEVSNEPNLGEAGGCPYLFTGEGFAEYYSHTVKAVLRADPSAKVGGPALAGPAPDDKGIAHHMALVALKENLPVDFFSWHHYSPNASEFGKQAVAARKMLQGYGGPLASATTVIDEWNLSWVCDLQFGEFQVSSFLVDAVTGMLDGGLDVSNFYHAQDVQMDGAQFARFFSPENLGLMKQHWMSDYQGHYILRRSGEPAGAYIAFKMLSEMQGQRLASTRPAANVGVLAARDEKACRILLWNYHHESLSPAQANLVVANLPDGRVKASHFCLGESVLDVASVFAMRRGQKRLVSQQEQDLAGGRFEKSLVLPPYCIHQIVLEY